MPVGKKALDRISDGLKRYRTILANARKRDVSESDTVVIIGDMLADMLGYEKYVEISTEFAVKGTYVDLAVKVGKEIHFLVEAKAIGVELKDIHVRQAVDYGANQGVEWAVVTNGAAWRVYRIEFKKPIAHALVAEVDLLASDIKDGDAVEFFANLCKEGSRKEPDGGILRAASGEQQAHIGCGASHRSYAEPASAGLEAHFSERSDRHRSAGIFTSQ